VLAGLGSAPQFLAILGVEAALQVRGTGGEGGGGGSCPEHSAHSTKQQEPPTGLGRCVQGSACHAAHH
jgi:hypothetical protein